MPEKQKALMPEYQKAKKASKNSLGNCEFLSFAAKEAFKRLRKNVEIELSDMDGKCRTIGITSARPSEGKSTVSVNLAYFLAEHNAKVLLIDADLRRSSIHEKLSISNTSGLSTLLLTEPNISSVIRRYEGSNTAVSFDVIPSGETVSNPSELLDSRRMQSIMAYLSNLYDYIILDLPPVGAVIDAVSVAQFIDGIIVVMKENNCSRSEFSDCIYQLERASVRILGFVVNGAMEGSGKSYKYNYNYKYGY